VPGGGAAAPSNREKTQWYFQRYAAHLPRREMLFDRSWYNRAGVERVIGFCTDAEYEEFFRSVLSSKRCWSARHPAGEILVLHPGRGTGFRFRSGSTTR